MRPLWIGFATLLLAAGLALLPGCEFLEVAPKRKGVPRTIVFVCEHGVARSVVAAKHFEREAQARGLHIRVVARGALPADGRETTPQEILADGFELRNFHPTQLTEADLDSAWLVVSFGPQIPLRSDGYLPVHFWDDTPAIDSNYAQARNHIRHKIGRLLDVLTSERKAHK